MGIGASGAGLDRNRMVADLARCELLADASPEDLWRLADLLTPVSAAAGVGLMAPADAADGFLFVTRGRVGVAAATNRRDGRSSSSRRGRSWESSPCWAGRSVPP